MPYCSQCGNQVEEAAGFCGKCGARQPPSRRPAADYLARITPRTASMLCYVPVLGWLPAIVVLASEKFRENRAVRFHAFQGLYLFVAWLIVGQVLEPIWGFLPAPHIPVHRILQAVLWFGWIFMIVKASHEQPYSLPILGELAERSVSEK